MTRTGGILIAALAVVAAFFGGVQVVLNPDTPVVGRIVHNAFVARDTATSPDDVQQLIQRDYYRSVKPGRLLDGSISGMLKTLKDPYSGYLTPRENKLFRESIENSYSGIGVSVADAKKKTGILVGTVFPGPAKRGGIVRGDRIVAVNGKSLAGVAVDIAVARIKGPTGSFVTVTVVKPTGKRDDVRLRRQPISPPVTVSKLFKSDGQKVGVVRLAEFVNDSDKRVLSEIRKMQRQGARRFVLDLRANPGGRLVEAVKVASIFLKSGRVVVTDGRNQPRNVYDVSGEAALPTAPLVVLIDQGTASSSEIVAGALQDRGRARLVGRRSFGKGVFQELTELENGGSVKLTVGEYFLPGGRNLTKNGLRPDTSATDNRKTRADEQIKAAVRLVAAQRLQR